jgi:hypothetical protein
MELGCAACGNTNQFDQPYPYHAGFGDQGFLYNAAGNCTLVWSILDPVYESLLARHSPKQPWALTSEAQREFEQLLPPSPRGDRWRFSNPPRCQNCGEALSAPMGPESIYYLVYPESVVLELGPFRRSLQVYIEDGAGS